MLEARLAEVEAQLSPLIGLYSGGSLRVPRIEAGDGFFVRPPLGGCAFDVNVALEAWPAWRILTGYDFTEPCLILGAVDGVAKTQTFDLTVSYARKRAFLVMIGFFNPGTTTGTFYFRATDNTGSAQTVEQALTTNQSLINFSFVFPLGLVTSITVSSNSTETDQGGRFVAFVV